MIWIPAFAGMSGSGADNWPRFQIPSFLKGQSLILGGTARIAAHPA